MENQSPRCFLIFIRISFPLGTEALLSQSEETQHGDEHLA